MSYYPPQQPQQAYNGYPQQQGYPPQGGYQQQAPQPIYVQQEPQKSNDGCCCGLCAGLACCLCLDCLC